MFFLILFFLLRFNYYCYLVPLYLLDLPSPTNNTSPLPYHHSHDIPPPQQPALSSYYMGFQMFFVLFFLIFSHPFNLFLTLFFLSTHYHLILLFIVSTYLGYFALQLVHCIRGVRIPSFDPLTDPHSLLFGGYFDLHFILLHFP